MKPPQPTQGYVVDESYGKTSTDVVAGEALYEEDLGGEANNKFIKHGYQDVWAIPLFIVVMLGTIIAGIVYQKDMPSSGTTAEVSADAQKYLPWAAVTSVVLAVASLIIMRAKPVGYIYFANIVTILLVLAVAIVSFANGAIFMGVLLLVAALFNAVWFYSVRHRIPFAALLLKTSVNTHTRYWGSFITGLVTLVVLCVFFAFWAMATTPVMGALEGTKGKTGAGNFFASFLLIWILFWAIQVGANVVHVTASGVMATWYFVGGDRMPPSPVPANLKRAMTTSFGSICFGSLVVAFLKTLYYFCRRAIDTIDHPIAECILSCILGVIERLTEMFNIYAFTHVAIYGHDFVTAAKETFQLVKECGWALVFNDCLVWPVLGITNFIGSLAVGILFGVVSGSVGVGVMAFLLANAVFTIFMRPVYSGIATQFVCVAENPTAMQAANPAYAEEMFATVPPDMRNGVQQAQHV